MIKIKLHLHTKKLVNKVDLYHDSDKYEKKIGS